MRYGSGTVLHHVQRRSNVTRARLANGQTADAAVYAVKVKGKGTVRETP